MRKKTKIIVLKTFGKEDMKKILKKVVRDNIIENQNGELSNSGSELS